MGLLDRFDPLVRAGRSRDSDRFLRTLVRSEVWFVGAPAIEGRAAEDLPPEALADFLESAMSAAGEAGVMTPWSFEQDGRRVFPFFTSRDLLERFLQSYVSEVNQIIPFQVGQAHFGQLLSIALSCDQVIMNPRSSLSRTVGSEERAVLARAAARSEQ